MYVKSYLKWAGGKSRALDALLPLLREQVQSCTAYCEPFCGSCTVALNLPLPSRVLLCDINEDLIYLHKSLVETPFDTIDRARQWFMPQTNSRDFFTFARRYYNTLRDPHSRSVLLPYLNRHGFNGLMRYNRQGHFNTPYGEKEEPVFPEYAMQQFALSLSKAHFVCADFDEVLRRYAPELPKRTLYYFDPPYWTATGFTQYWRTSFGEEKQQALAGWARRLSRAGATVVISNADNEHTRALYADASQIHALDVQRTISGNNSGRAHAREVVAIYEPV